LAVIGYARVSTGEQHLDLQRNALNEAGCTRIFEDEGVSAVATHRPGFKRALKSLKKGDTLVIWKMDRAFRSLRHALDTLEMFESRGIAFRSLTDQIDTETAMGRFIYQITNAFAELERNLISERTRAGMEAARRRGSVLGRPRKLSEDQIRQAMQDMADDPALTLDEVAEPLGVSPRTLARAMKSL